MKIPDDVLDEARTHFSAKDTNFACALSGDLDNQRLAALVSFVVENSIDYEALANLLFHDDSGPDTMLAEQSPEMQHAYRGEARKYAAALGIGDTDE